MLDSFLFLWQWTWLRVCFGLYAVLLAVGLGWFVRRRSRSADFASSQRWRMAFCLALCLTPSAITNFSTAGFIGPAAVGLLFCLPLLFGSGHPAQAWWAVGLLYVLPLTVAVALFYVTYPWYRRFGRSREVPDA